MAEASDRDIRVGQVLDAAAEFFSDYLWSSEVGASIRSRLASEGVEERTARAFGLGYAPGEHREVFEHLGAGGFSAAELVAAGVATPSGRGRAHAHFRSVVMFPIRARDGTLLGFAGMATNPGPSWPLWLTSPDRGRFDRRAAIFAIDRAAAAIGKTKRAVVVDDCLEVLRRHQAGRCEAVAVIRSPITSEHVAQIAGELGVPADAVRVERREGDQGSVITPLPEGSAEPAGLPADEKAGDQDRVRASASAIRPDPLKHRTPAQRVFLQLARVALGLGVPLAWIAIVRPDPDAPGGAGTAFVGAVGAVAATYVILAIVAAIAAGRIRARSRSRRMRGPWERSMTEWQPIAWTYHMLDDILIGAALVSIVVCTVLFVTIGGFTR